MIPVIIDLGITMSEIGRHERIYRRGHNITSYKKELGETSAVAEQEESLDTNLLKLVFVSMVAAVAFGLSILAVTF